MSFLKFPNNFLWGGATASEQLEGKNKFEGRTIWDKYFELHPSDFFNQVGPQITSDFTAHFKDDIKQWKDVVGVNSVRLGFSWAKLFNKGEELNKDVLNYYHQVLDELNENGIKPFMTLYHFDLPEWAINIGGWANREVVNKFEKFAEFIFDEFDSKVFAFITMNEPIVPIIAGYLGMGKHWPKVYDPQLAYDNGNMMILAHAKAVNKFNSKTRSSKIGVVINVSPTHPRDINDKEDVVAANNYHLFHNEWMLDTMILGKFPERLNDFFAKLGASKFNLSPEDVIEISNIRLDIIGTNFYFPTRLKKYEGEKVSNEIDKFATVWNDPNARMNVHRGWEIFPEDIYNTAMLIKEKYNNIPFFISENGMGVENEGRFRGQNGEIQDDYRIAFVQEHLEWLHKAIVDGANCFGYHMWAIMDCWSWANAYKNRYGFIEVDLESQKRLPKKSANWFKKVVIDNGFDNNYVKLDEIRN